ncbi:MAG: nitroreductase, partial [Chloroflexi bacterium]|nr:nitroreductase [Chloroflexota bacterium]
MMKEIVARNRSYRRFHQEMSIELDTLKELVDLARLSASAMNLQPLKYYLSCEPQKNTLIFQHIGWA